MESGAALMFNGGTCIGRGAYCDEDGVVNRAGVFELLNGSNTLINGGTFKARGGANIFYRELEAHLQIRTGTFDTHVIDSHGDCAPGEENYNGTAAFRMLDSDNNERYYRLSGGTMGTESDVFFDEYKNQWVKDYAYVVLDRTDRRDGENIPNLYMTDARELGIRFNTYPQELLQVTRVDRNGETVMNKEPLVTVLWSNLDREMKLSYTVPAYYTQTNKIPGYSVKHTWLIWKGDRNAVSADPDRVVRTYSETVELNRLVMDWASSSVWTIQCRIEEQYPGGKNCMSRSQYLEIALDFVKTYTVAFDANGGYYASSDGTKKPSYAVTGELDADSSSYAITLPAQFPVRENYKFKHYTVLYEHSGSQVSADTWQPGDTVQIQTTTPAHPNAVTVKAHWARIVDRGCERVELEYPLYFDQGDTVTITAKPTPAVPAEGVRQVII